MATGKKKKKKKKKIFARIFARILPKFYPNLTRIIASDSPLFFGGGGGEHSVPVSYAYSNDILTQVGLVDIIYNPALAFTH